MAPTERLQRLAGAAALIAGLLACLVVAVDGDGGLGGGFTASQITIHGPGQAALAVALVGIGFVTLMSPRPPSGVLVAIATLVAAQLAATGLVGFRRWPLYWGCCAPAGITEQSLARALSMLMAAGCALAVLACVVALVATRQQWRVHAGPVGALALVAGAVVAVAGPLLAVTGHYDDSVPDLVAWALMYSLPLGAGLALSGRMGRTRALTLVAAVALSTVAATAGESFLERRQPWGPALTLMVVATAVVATSRLLPRSGSAGTRRAATSPRTPAA